MGLLGPCAAWVRCGWLCLLVLLKLIFLCGGERAGAPGSGGADAAEQGFGQKNAARTPTEQGSDGAERRPGPERWFGGPEARPGAGWCAAEAGNWWRWRRWVGGASGLAKG